MTSTIVGINRSSDASVAIAADGRLRTAVAKERLSGRKHAWGALGDVADFYAPRVIDPVGRPDLIVECYSSDRERERLAEYHGEFEGLWPGVQRLEISHHLAHVYGAFHPSPFDRAAVLVVDFQGSRARDIPYLPAGTGDADDLEVISSYRAARGEAPVLHRKQLWNKDDVPVSGLGSFYSALKDVILPGDGTEGTVMGLASLGDPDRLGLNPLVVEDGAVHVPDDWQKILHSPRGFQFVWTGAGSLDAAADFAAAGQRAFEDALVELARWLHTTTGERQLVYTGGCALNCAANERLRNESGFDDVWIPPAPHDGGTAVGCVLYGAEQTGAPIDFRWTHDFLGPEPDLAAAIDRAERDEDLRVVAPVDLADRAAEAIHHGHLVAVFRGSAESGPRALGHRSILGNARYPVVRDFINRAVKRRQWFRPLAPMVQREHAQRWFDFVGDSPFMLRAVAVRPDAHGAIPAVVHHDGTARIQTVDRDDDPFIWNVLEGLRASSGVGVMLNTSLNGPGQPIVETADEALDFFLSVPIHHLVLGDRLITKRDAPEHPLRT